MGGELGLIRASEKRSLSVVNHHSQALDADAPPTQAITHLTKYIPFTKPSDASLFSALCVEAFRAAIKLLSVFK